MDVIERVPGEVRYGFFFEEIYGFGASAYAVHKNFFGKFNEFSTSFQIAQHKQEITLGYANPLLFGTSFTFIPTAIRFEDHLTFNHEKINPPAYPDSVEERYEIINRGDLTFGITNNIKFRGTIDTRYVNKNEDKLFKLKGEIALTFDYTNDYFNPTKGVRVFPTVGIGTNFSGKHNYQDGRVYTYGELTANVYMPKMTPACSIKAVPVLYAVTDSAASLQATKRPSKSMIPQPQASSTPPLRRCTSA